MKPSVRCVASLAALGTLASCGVPAPDAQPVGPAATGAQSSADATALAKTSMPALPPPPSPAAARPAAPRPSVTADDVTALAKASAQAPAVAPSAPAPQPPAVSQPSSAPVVGNEVRSATVSYEAPPGKEEVTFSVTVAPDGTITSAASKGKAVHPKSVGYQEAFAAGISGAVVGKKISELDVRAVGGASLTTAAFVKYVRSF